LDYRLETVSWRVPMGQMAHQAFGLYRTAREKDTISEIIQRDQKNSPTSVKPVISGLNLES